VTDEERHFTVRNELDLIFYTCSAAWPHLIARGGGSIINTGSICGVGALAQTPGSIAHAATKGAVIAMTSELALQGGPHSIRANTISPAIIDSPATAEQLAGGTFREDHLASLILRRIGTPADVAAAALFLASDESSWVTGANLLVDGGVSAH
jgi:meso-butanediol dehydrogenase / (S,S)-butanediol dehydrogenase / diacetyl reductase